MATKKDQKRTQRRIHRVRDGLKRVDMPRISVFRSNKHIYGQIIDDSLHKTLISVGSHAVESKGDKSQVARAVGLKLAEEAKSKGITNLVFDRGPYKYHGRVKALAEGLRDGGITI